MARPSFNDIIPPDKKSIKRIPIPDRSNRNRISEQENSSREQKITPRAVYKNDDRPEPPRRRTKKRGGRKFFALILILAVILAGAYFFTPKTHTAKVSIVLKGQTVNIDSDFSASNMNAAATGTLAFAIESIPKDGQMTMTANGREPAETKASGTIVVYNNYSSASQKLVANTRFQTPEGLIFRIQNDITVPGKSGSTPGSVEAKVVADKSGDKYNVGYKDFTIPGFKGDPRFDKFYGRSKTPIDGGFIGTRASVDQTQATANRSKIREQLKDELVRTAQQDIPSDYIMPNNAYYIEFESQPDVQGDGNSVNIVERGTLHGFMFKRADLAHAVADKAGVSDLPVDNFLDAQALDFTMRGTATSSSGNPWDTKTVDFHLRGTTTLVAGIDIDKLKAELENKPRNSLQAIMSGYPGVAKADAAIDPLWKSRFPADPANINVVISDKPAIE